MCRERARLVEEDVPARCQEGGRARASRRESEVD